MTVSSSIGPASGIDYGKLIEGLVGIEQRPIDKLTKQLTKVEEQSNAFLSLSALMTGLKISATSFSASAVFRSTTAASSNTGVLSATSSIGAATGAYSFTVQRLASSSQIVSQGFAEQSSSVESLGLVSKTSPLKKLDQAMKLADLNGGTGVARGSIKITNRSGAATTVDLTRAVTINDVVSSINAAGAGVTASLKNDQLVLTDTTGASASNLIVEEVGSTTTAANLGILQNVAAGTLTGTDINRLNVNTRLASLNNGNGIRLATSGEDFSITSNTGAIFKVSLAGATTIGDVINKINAAGKVGSTQIVSAALSADGHGLTITDSGGGFGATALAATNGSNAARDLGLLNAAAGNVITGSRINAGLATPLLRDLNNGAGIGTGTFTITDRNGVATDVTLDGSQATVQDLLDTINSAGAGVTASLSTNKLGITLTDTSGGGGTLSVADSSGTVAAALGLVQSVSSNTLKSTNLDLRNQVAARLTFQLGKGRVDDVAKLADLNGGKGVGRGSIRITDGTGAVGVVDLSKAIDLKDVVEAINNAPTLNMVASLEGDRLVLTDQSGGVGALAVTNVGTGTTATDLGLTVPFSNAGGVLKSADLNKLNTGTNLRALNNGNGVRTAGTGVNDLAIAWSGGSKSISLAGARTLNDVINTINSAGLVNGVQAFSASIAADGHRLVLTDHAAVGASISVTAENGSLAARDLGLLGSAPGGTLTGERINGQNASALLRELNGGSGVNLGTVRVTNRLGAATDVDLSGLESVEDVIRTINGAGAGVTAALSSSGTSLVLTDATGSTTGDLTVEDVSGTAAADLGLAGSVAGATLAGEDLHLRYISNDTALSFLNGGNGIKAGKIKLSDAAGNTSVVDLTDTSLTTVGAVIARINANSTGIRASVNADGNGILLTDTSTGTLGAKVEEVDGGGAAASLNLLGDFTGNVKDGSFQKTVDILTTDTLQTIATKVSQANVGVIASVISDGSGSTPFRLSFASRYSGAAGRLVFDGGALGINATTIADGADGAIVYGSNGVGLQATSSTNTYSSLVTGLTITATSLGSATVTVSRDDTKIVDSVKSFTESYNKVLENIKELTKFDPNKPSDRGILFGDSTIQNIQQALGSFITKVFAGTGQYKTLSAAGITVKEDATLEFNEDRLRTALNSNPEDLRTLFTTKTSGVGDVLSNLLDQYTNAQTGVIFKTTDALKTTTTQLNARVQNLNDLLTNKKNRLIRQFANLEVSIAKLQQQGTALANFKPVSANSN